jgi:hypothetical protein
MKYLEAVIFKYWLTFLVFILTLFKRQVPKSLDDNLKDFIEDLKYHPDTPDEKRY